MFFSKKRKIDFYNKNRENVKWKVPSLFCHDPFILLLSDYCKELGIKQPVESVYGGVKSAWSGGRLSQIETIDEKYVSETISEHNKRGIGCAFTFSNYKINEEDLEDKQANLMLKIAGEISDNNFAIVSSELLAEYIRDKYPKIKLIASIIRPMYEYKKYDETPEYYNNLCKRYDKVVVRPEFYFDRSFMKKLNQKNKIELMTNLGCLQKCPLARRHYDLTVELDAGRETALKHMCHKDMNKLESVYRTTYISNEEIDDLIKMGFTHFKLKGRGYSDVKLMGLIGSYIFKPTGYFQHLESIIYEQLGPK